ncbi:MAG: hypothetical protein EXQ99_06935 [Alphaproteobacteria bacterium]|nr:hypothetical protein [Alphaproteobacteria bacterium]
MFEETMLAAVEALTGLARSSGLEVGALCLGGSAALNAPSNSRIARESPFTQVSVSAGCDDSGLATGAALAAYHNVLDQPRPTTDPHQPAAAYLGLPYDEVAIGAALEEFDTPVTVQTISDAPESAARDLAAGNVIGWFEERREIGPYVLGHRSILANPRLEGTLERVNKITSRETWQPLAASILETEATDWFAGAPISSPAWLFAGIVRSVGVPAFGQGRVRYQTIVPATGDLYHVLRAFYVLTQMPLVASAALKTADEPLIETPLEALKFFAASELDALYLGGYRIAHRAAVKATGKAAAKKAKSSPTKTARTTGRAQARPGRRASK